MHERAKRRAASRRHGAEGGRAGRRQRVEPAHGEPRAAVDPVLLWSVLGGVGVLLAVALLALFLQRDVPSPEEQVRAARLSARAAEQKEAFFSTAADDREEAERARKEAEREALRVAAAKKKAAEEKEKASARQEAAALAKRRQKELRDLIAAERRAEEDALKKARAAARDSAENQTLHVNDEPPPPSAPPAAALPAVDSSRLMTLVVAGSLGGSALPADDQQTWARIGHFLQTQSKVPFALVYPDGAVRQTKRADTLGGAAPLSQDLPRSATASPPLFRLVMQAKGYVAGATRFYGTALARNYECVIQCSLERLEGEDYKAFDTLSAKERLSPSVKRRETPEQILRTAYDMALQQLVTRLQGHPLFAGSSEA